MSQETFHPYLIFIYEFYYVCSSRHRLLLKASITYENSGFHRTAAFQLTILFCNKFNE